MEDLNAKVLRAFEIKPSNIRKERGGYILNTKSGYKIIKKSMDNPENIMFQNDVKKHLINSGYNNIDRLYNSVTGKPYFFCDFSLYIMLDYYRFPEADFTNNMDYIKTIESVAKFHKTLKSFRYEGNVSSSKNEMLEMYEKSKKEMAKIKKSLNLEKRLSEFDVLFFKNFPYYSNRVNEAYSILKETSLGQEANDTQICHNLLKEENIFINSSNTYITNFSECKIKNSIFDLESLIRRYTKNIPEDHIKILEIIDIYNNINPLSKDNLKALYSLLKYPGKYLRICSQYYTKKRNFIPGSINLRIQHEIAQKEVYDKYINELLTCF